MKDLLSRLAVAAATPLLRCFQVYPPVLLPTDSTQVALTNGPGGASIYGPTVHGRSCIVTQTLMTYSFANSYGQPFVGTYSPPDCPYNRVALNFTVTAAGRQFDRLAVMYLGDTEVWRTSTAEPTRTGIIWTYIKDVSEFKALFDRSQKLIFDLGNIVDSTYTSPFNTTLTATFFTADDTIDPADQIYAVSSMQSANNAASAWQVPRQTAQSRLTLPQNVRKAVFTVSATGQIDEEFWYTNVPSSDVDTFGVGSFLGYSPFREVQLLIDGQLAGVAWPFPIIFTGGIIPSFWRPLVGIDAFDLREDEIDITPWLPLLCDGGPHSFEIRIAGIEDDGRGNGRLTNSVGSYWVVTGKVFVWLDSPSSKTTGSMPQISAPSPSIQISSSTTVANGSNQTLTYQVDVARRLTISSNVRTSQGTKISTWTQNLDYSNNGYATNAGLQFTAQDSSGTALSSSGYSRKFDYPITLNYTQINEPQNGFSLAAQINRGQDIQVFGSPVFPTGLQSFEAYASGPRYPTFQGSQLSTTQNGSAFYIVEPALNYSASGGTTQQDMTFNGLLSQASKHPSGFPRLGSSYELYHRHVVATNGSVVDDNERLIGGVVGGFREVNGQPHGQDWVVRLPHGKVIPPVAIGE